MLIPLLASCAGGTRHWASGVKDEAETGDSLLTVQAAKLPYDKNDSASVNFRVRISINTDTLNYKRSAESMMYRMDSCFYLQANGKKYYPQLTQAVASGVNKRFEYLVSFDSKTLLPLQKVNMVYQDRYLDHKTYTLLLK